jgi:hypothetical protein
VARHLLDGLVPTEVATQYGTPEWVTRLTDAGLWETVPGGHYMPRYLNEDKNPTRQKVLEDRKAKAERQRKWLENLHSPSSTQRRVSRRSSSASNGASGDGPEDAAHPPSLTGRKGAHARAAREGASVRPPPPLPVEQHPFKPDANGITCEICELPETSRLHPEAT